ncbi:ribosome assembly protein rrb1 [Moniliophthora roreri]|nr:ribosome assembly protein rrb1 [Moniliophthora roreri]
MSKTKKRSANESEHPDRDEASVKIARDEKMQSEPADADDLGEYEDPWEDEHESDGEVVDGQENEENGDAMQVDEADEDTRREGKRPFILGVDEVPEGDTLEPDESTYIMRHDLGMDCSCLSFDILVDDLGENRQRLPTSAYVVTGSQARRPQDNKVSILKLSSLHRTQIHGRQLPPPSQPYYTGVWSETGKVHVYDVRPFIEHLNTPGYKLDRKTSQKASFTIDAHSTEGYAIDWNAPSPSSLSLLTGDNAGSIYLTTASNSGFRTFPNPFLSHQSSVEDIQWSPTEITVFASCSSDQSIRMWDIRSKARQSVAAIQTAHESDVNVISWNRSTSYLLVSGDDNGEIKIWDLRNVRQGNTSHVAHFNWHKGPITSIEWHPSDDSVFAASGDDNQITLWDLAVEADDESARQVGDVIPGHPPQLLFTHYQERVKELHWHPQIPGTIISTGIGGLSVFKTISV